MKQSPLERAADDEYSLLNIKDPHVVTILKGRPSKKRPFATSVRLVPARVNYSGNGFRPTAPTMRRAEPNWKAGDVGEESRLLELDSQITAVGGRGRGRGLVGIQNRDDVGIFYVRIGYSSSAARSRGWCCQRRNIFSDTIC